MLIYYFIQIISLQHNTIQYKYKTNTNTKMYALYHHFLNKVKEQQIQKYNTKHRAYLIRSGKMPANTIPQRNQNINSNNVPRRNVPSFQQQYNQPAVVQPMQPTQAKPRRQRQFNRPTRNQEPVHQQKVDAYQFQDNRKTANQMRQEEQRAIRPASKFNEQKLPVQRDRPIKQNKLTPQQLQYLNQNQYSQNTTQPPQNVTKVPQKPSKPDRQHPLPQPKPLPTNQLPQYQEPVQLIQCSICGRKFREQVLLKHQGICDKVFQQKRKPFEVKIIDDEDAEKIKKKVSKKVSSKSDSIDEKGDKKQSKWKNQSEIFRNMLKKGRGEKVENQIVEEDTRIPCPGCGRRFNDKAAAKHIQYCTKKPKKH